jgi:hypothetical protein
MGKSNPLITTFSENTRVKTYPLFKRIQVGSPLEIHDHFARFRLLGGGDMQHIVEEFARRYRLLES